VLGEGMKTAWKGSFSLHSRRWRDVTNPAKKAHHSPSPGEKFKT
jgi:hypothetical protein